MSDTAAYPGSPSLSPEARDKVLQTFRHTLELAKSGRNDEALLGCDFILKMDSRFTPARKLLESLRGVAAGTVIDTSAFMPYIAPAAKPAPAVPQGSTVISTGRPPAPAGPPPAPPAPEPLNFDFTGSPAPAAPPPAPAPPAGFGGADPFAAAAAAAPAFGPDPFGAPPATAAPSFPDFGPPPASAPDPFSTSGTSGMGFSFSPTPDSGPDPFAPFGAPAGTPAAPPDPFATSALPATGFGSFGPAPAQGFQPAPGPDPFAPPPASAPAPGGFGDHGFAPAPAFPGAPADPFAAFGAPSAPPADPFAAFGAPSAPPADPFAAFGAPSTPPADTFGAFGAPSTPPADPFAAFGAPSTPPSDNFGAFGAQSALPADPFAAAGAPSAPADPFASFGVSAAPAGPSSMPAMGAPTGTDPRIIQFLRQGDDAMSRGQVQEAIDLWSRVFLIDLSNEDASRRIDQAREKQAQTAQQVDMLVSEGMQFFERGDLSAARARFLEVLTISENDSTARSYLSQIDAAMAPAGGSGAAGSPFGPSLESSYGETEQPLYAPPAEDLGLEGEEGPQKAVTESRKPRVDPKILIGVGVAAVLVIVAGLYFTMGKKPAPAPVPVETTKGPVKPIGEDLIGKAQGLFDQGRVDEALQILVSIPDSDARHPEALAMIDRFKTTAIPTPSTAGPAIDLDQLKAQGLASIRSSRYIDAVKALDPVVKARPEDSEAALALAKAREEISALSSALKAYNEQDYLTAIRLLYPIYIKDKKNQDAEEFLFRSFFNDGIQKMQAGTFKDASEAFAEAAKFRPSDEEVQRHLRFTRKYPRGPEDLLSRIYVKHTAPRL